MTTDTHFLREWHCEWSCHKASELAECYHRETEAYNRTVCTGKNRYGEVVPVGPHELGVVNRNARKVREQIMYEAELNGISRKDMARAISHYMLMCP